MDNNQQQVNQGGNQKNPQEQITSQSPIKNSAGPVSFANTVAASTASSTVPVKTEAKTIIFGAYENNNQQQPPRRLQPTAGNHSSIQNHNQNQSQKRQQPMVYIPRTQSAPPKENELTPTLLPVYSAATATVPAVAQVPAKPVAQSAQASHEPPTGMIVKGFHLDAAPYNPNAQMFFPVHHQQQPYHYHNSHNQNYYAPPSAVAGFRQPRLQAPVTTSNAPVMTTTSTVAPVVASANASSIPVPVSPPHASNSSVTSQTFSATPSIPTIMRTPSKAIKIVNPATKEALKLDTIPKITAESKPVVTVTAPSAGPSASAQQPATSEPALTKKIIPIIDPSSHKPVNLSSPLAEQELADAFISMTINHEVDMDDDVESSTEGDPGLLGYGQTISYPDRYLPYQTPVDSTGVWKYSRRFLIQFMPVCTQKPDKASFFSRVARKDQQHRGGKRVRKVLTEAERQALMSTLSKSANAWAPVADESLLAEEERILREAKGVLNKLTMEKFDVLSEKIISMGIMSSQNVLERMIDLFFDKSVEEPRFASMYAMLCLKISRKELEDARTQDQTAGKVESKFRRLLLNKCQHEFKNKRDWSCQRQQQGVKPQNDALTEEDYAMIKMKRRVLGNMRFIGELYMQGLITVKIMHEIINELSSNPSDNPEDDEIECLCKLMSTVGRMIDVGESIPVMNKYIERLRTLATHKGLQSRIRFACLDVIDLRSRAWIEKMPTVAAPAPGSPQLSFASVSSSSSRPLERTVSVKTRHGNPPSGSGQSSDGWSRQQLQQSEGWSKQPLDRQGDKWNHQQQPREEQEGWKQQSEGWKVKSTSPQPQQQQEGWKVQQLQQPPKPQQPLAKQASVTGKKSFNLNDLRKEPAKQPVALATSSSQEYLNKFDVLNETSLSSTAGANVDPGVVDPEPVAVQETSAQEPIPANPKEPKLEDKSIPKALSVYTEYIAQGNLNDLLEAVGQVQDKEQFAYEVLVKILEGTKPNQDQFSRFVKESTISKEQWRMGFLQVLQELDDLAVDVPTCFATLPVLAKTVSMDMLKMFPRELSAPSRFKLHGHWTEGRFEDFDFSTITPAASKTVALYIQSNKWHMTSPRCAEILLQYSLESIKSLTHWFPKAKAIISNDFGDTLMPAPRALSIILQQGFLQVLKNPDSANDQLTMIISPFLTTTGVKGKLREVVLEAGRRVKAEKLAEDFVQHLVDNKFI